MDWSELEQSRIAILGTGREGQAAWRFLRARLPGRELTLIDEAEPPAAFRGELARMGGLAYLAELAERTPTAANIVQHGKIIRETTAQAKSLQSYFDYFAGMADNSLGPSSPPRKRLRPAYQGPSISSVKASGSVTSLVLPSLPAIAVTWSKPETS